MGSPSTRPTVPQRWPRNAERQRQNIYHSAEDGRELLDASRAELEKAITKIVTNPGLAELMIRKAIINLADIQTVLGDIQKEAMAARIGVEPPQQETDHGTD